jgi:hypothetical protein
LDRDGIVELRQCSLLVSVSFAVLKRYFFTSDLNRILQRKQISLLSGFKPKSLVILCFVPALLKRLPADLVFTVFTWLLH